jgi:hypothetical protein
MKQIVVRNVELGDDVVMWLLMETESWAQVKRIEFYNTSLS